MTDRIQQALDIAGQFGNTSHNAWVIDQMVRSLTGCPLVEKIALDVNGNPYTYMGLGESAEYLAFVAAVKDGEDGAETYGWDTGTPP